MAAALAAAQAVRASGAMPLPATSGRPVCSAAPSELLALLPSYKKLLPLQSLAATLQLHPILLSIVFVLAWVCCTEAWGGVSH